MRIKVLQRTPNERPGAIKTWADFYGHELYVYHPYQFDGTLPTASETDLLVVLGGPMSPNDDIDWIKAERRLIKTLLSQHKPIFGACYGAQQIVKTMGYKVSKAPAKEVGWAPVHLQTHMIPGLPDSLLALHWHEEMFQVPDEATLLFSNELLKNQGYLLGDHVIGLQFHLEPQADDVREIAINDAAYALDDNALHQTAAEIMRVDPPEANRLAIFRMLDFITTPTK